MVRSPLVARFRSKDDIAPGDILAMYGLFAGYYENASIETFMANLSKKSGAILVRGRFSSADLDGLGEDFEAGAVEALDGFCDLVDGLHCEFGALVSEPAHVAALCDRTQGGIDEVLALPAPAELPDSVRTALSSITFRSEATRLVVVADLPETLAREALNVFVPDMANAVSIGLVGLGAPPQPPQP